MLFNFLHYNSSILMFYECLLTHPPDNTSGPEPRHETKSRFLSYERNVPSGTPPRIWLKYPKNGQKWLKMARSSLYIGYTTLFGGIFDVFWGYPLLWGGMGHGFLLHYMGGAGVFVRRPWISSHAEVPALTYYLGGESACTIYKLMGEDRK